jgi:pantetheine-phosphate adenylyltransferase
MERRAPSPGWTGVAPVPPLPSPFPPAYNRPFLTEALLIRIKAIYPGSFDPPTNGHLDLIERGRKIFDELVVAILRNPEKDPLFSVSERRNMLEAMTGGFDNVSVDTFDGLTIDYAMRVEATAILRGIRAISDYEYELQMALMNRKLQPGLETVFMMPAEKYSYLSSRLVREIAQLGGNIECLVPELVAQKLHEKIDPAHKFEIAAQADRKSSEKKPRSRKKKL